MLPTTETKMPLADRLKSAGTLLITGQIPETPEKPEPAREALVKQWCDTVKEGKKFWKPVFDKIVEEMEFSAGKQWADGDLDGDYQDKYQANIVQRHVSQKESALYAKNPKAIARRKNQLWFKIWDGSTENLQAARAAVAQSVADLQQAVAANPGVPVEQLQATSAPPPAEAVALLADYEQGMKMHRVLDRVAQTLELVYTEQVEGQTPDFKSSMKALVLTTIVCRVGWVKIGYHRETDSSPQATVQKTGVLDQLKAISQRAAVLSEKQDASSAVAEEVAIMLAQLQRSTAGGEGEVTREGLTFNFPATRSVLVDPNCRSLRGLVGARWLAEEFMLTAAQVFEAYGVRLRGTGAVVYAEDGHEPSPMDSGAKKQADNEDARFCVWEIYDHETQTKYVVCDGYPDFLEEPAAPQPVLDTFWPYYPLTFNRVVVEKNEPDKDVTIYPPSDVRLLMPLQKEINRSRDSLRLHRIHSLPRYAVSAAAGIDKNDVEALAAGTPGVVIKLNALPPDGDVNRVIQPIRTIPPDQAVYDTSHVMNDVLTVVGSAEANLGPVQSGVTATQSSIAEGSRLSAVSSNVDDLDDLLTWLAKVGGQILLSEMSRETVMQIAGPGAEWPEFNRQQIRKLLYLDIEASSSGRPNRNMEMQNFQQMAPVLMQIPGIKPSFMAREGIKRLDDRLSFDDAYDPGLAAQAAAAAQTLPPGQP